MLKKVKKVFNAFNISIFRKKEKCLWNRHSQKSGNVFACPKN
jgi:hypothetical protein